VEEPADSGTHSVKRYRLFDAAENPRPDARMATVAEKLPGWLQSRARADETPRPITPSMFYDESGPVIHAGSSQGRDKALARGNLVHRLMQSLPDLLPEWRENAARRYLARNGKDFSAAEQETLLAQVSAVLEDKRFAPLFGPGSRAEVPVVGRLRGRPVSGQIDRLVITAKAVLIADYKTNNPPPRRLEDVPPGYVAQLAIYRAMLAKLYPGRAVRAALVWTELPEIMEIPGSALDAALTAQGLS